MKHDYIGSEHVLLGLLREEEGLAARVLENFDVTVEGVRAAVTRITGTGEEICSGQIPFTPRAKKIMELSLREALSLGHNYIGTEHLLMGLLREGDGVAVRILTDIGVESEKVRAEIIRMLSGPRRFPPEGPAPTYWVVGLGQAQNVIQGVVVDAPNVEVAAKLAHQKLGLTSLRVLDPDDGVTVDIVVEAKARASR